MYSVHNRLNDIRDAYFILERSSLLFSATVVFLSVLIAEVHLWELNKKG